jgi:hypothetical protein
MGKGWCFGMVEFGLTCICIIGVLLFLVPMIEGEGLYNISYLPTTHQSIRLENFFLCLFGALVPAQSLDLSFPDFLVLELRNSAPADTQCISIGIILSFSSASR